MPRSNDNSCESTLLTIMQFYFLGVGEGPSQETKRMEREGKQDIALGGKVVFGLGEWKV